MNAKEARAKILEGSGQIIDNILIRASGIPGEFGERVKIDNKAESLVLSIITPMLQAESDARKLDADSAHGVIEMLSRGDISPKEAIELMNMFGVKSTIDTEKGILLELQRHSKTPIGWS
jgi:hypothetical protein